MNPERQKQGIEINARALELHGAGRYEQALALFEQAARLCPTDEHVMTNLGRCRAVLGQIDRAMDDFTRALQINPGYTESAFQRGKLRRQRGDYFGAIDDFTLLLRQIPTAQTTLIERGRTYNDIGDHRSALADFETLCQLRPDYYVGILYAALCHHSLKQWQPALQRLTRAMQLKPNDHPRNLYYLRSYAYEGLGDVHAALRDAEAALVGAAEPEPDLKPHIRRMNLLRRLGRDAEALEEQRFVDAERDRRVRKVADEGAFVWAALVMANREIYSPGEEDRGGVVAFTFRRDLPDLGSFLMKVAGSVGAVKGTRALTPEQQLLSHVTTNEYAKGRVRVPISFTNGIEAFCQPIQFHRSYLRSGTLAVRLVPCAATPGPEGSIVLLPWSLGEDNRAMLRKS